MKLPAGNSDNKILNESRKEKSCQKIRLNLEIKNFHHVLF